MMYDVTTKQQYCACANVWVLSQNNFFLQELDYKEFKMFAMACIDRQMEIEERKKRQSERTGGEEDREEGRGWCAIQLCIQ
jgi:hypothetical protein